MIDFVVSEDSFFIIYEYDNQREFNFIIRNLEKYNKDYSIEKQYKEIKVFKKLNYRD